MPTTMEFRLTEHLRVAPRCLLEKRANELAVHLRPAISVELSRFKSWLNQRGDLGHREGVSGLVEEYMEEAWS